MLPEVAVWFQSFVLGCQVNYHQKGKLPSKICSFYHPPFNKKTQNEETQNFHTFPPFLSLFYLRFSSFFPPSPDSDSVRPRQNTATDTQRFGFIDVADGQLLACGKYIEHELDDHHPGKTQGKFQSNCPNSVTLKSLKKTPIPESLEIVWEWFFLDPAKASYIIILYMGILNGNIGDGTFI